MLKQIVLLIGMGVGVVNFCGCWALLGGAVVGGAGTAVWLSGKMTQQFNASYPKTVDASIQALHSLNFPVVKETQNDMDTQIKSTYSDGSDMWIDIHRITDTSSKVEVRVGAVTPHKEAAAAILNKIQSNL